MDDDNNGIFILIVVGGLAFFAIGLYLGVYQINYLEDREHKKYVKCLEDEQSNCKELHKYFIKLIDNDNDND